MRKAYCHHFQVSCLSSSSSEEVVCKHPLLHVKLFCGHALPPWCLKSVLSPLTESQKKHPLRSAGLVTRTRSRNGAGGAETAQSGALYLDGGADSSSPRRRRADLDVITPHVTSFLIPLEAPPFLNFARLARGALQFSACYFLHRMYRERGRCCSDERAWWRLRKRLPTDGGERRRERSKLYPRTSAAERRQGVSVH